MENVSTDRKCAQPACQCTVAGAEEYCSDYCRMTPGHTECRCGHEMCTHHSITDKDAVR
jgi:hypothetical protein